MNSLMGSLCIMTERTLLTVSLYPCKDIVTTKWKVHQQTKAEALGRDFKVLNKIAVHNYATTANVSYTG